MRLLEYASLDSSHCPSAYAKVVAAIERDDFRSAEIKKLTHASGHFYRARLDHTNRLLLTFVRHGEQTCALALEIIEQHAYEKSRFLRGARIDESKIPAVESVESALEASPMRYLHPTLRRVQFLDKPLSFDELQDRIYAVQPPVIVVGSAGSGKTALTLEKLKLIDGEVLYVTQSAYLAKNARELYYAHGYERDGQDAHFLSYREFLETLRIPDGREATWRDFAGWFDRQRQAFKGIDPHQAFEEIRGVILAQAAGALTLDGYRQLGVRQSIFIGPDRDRVYQLFERYRGWLAQSQLYDANMLAHLWQQHASPRYDFVVIDEVQDLTQAQLKLVLSTLRTPDRFMLCGDSNQIVHPNFFAWAQVKTLFWRDEQIAARQELRVLNANFRNSIEATRVANTLLKIKHQRFGSIDRESNFLVNAVGGDSGAVTLLADRDAVRASLDEQTRASTQCAVLVLRDEDKTAARSHFRTPLVFSVHEAKGLEYEHIVLFRCVSNYRAEYAEVCDGVLVEDLQQEQLEYRRAHDKTDKSLEIYKFFVNALYVALTRALRQIYLVESDTGHPLLRLLGLTTAEEQARLNAQAASREDWQKEARKLELQGKQEQADAIRQTILKETPVPWPVFDEAKLRETLIKVFRDNVPGSKPRQQLQDYAACYGESPLAARLSNGAMLPVPVSGAPSPLARRHYAAYFGKNFKEVLRQCELYGIEHRTPMNQTPLMAAASAGNVALVEALLERGADLEALDHLGRNALHWALQRAFGDAEFAAATLPRIYDLIAPSAIDIKVDQRLVRIDKRLTEYLLVQTLWTLFRGCFPQHPRGRGGFSTATVLAAWKSLPAAVLRPERNQRAHLSNVLSRNEVDRDYAWNRRLFARVATGWYQFNPMLFVRRTQDQWVPILTALNLPLVHELQPSAGWQATQALWQQVSGIALAVPVLWQRAWEEQQAAAAARERSRAHLASAAVPRSPSPASPSGSGFPAEGLKPAAPWGTPAARARELQKLAERIATKRSREAGNSDESK